MKEISLTKELKDDLVDYIVNIEEGVKSPNTIKSYTNILDRIFKKYKVINKDTYLEMWKRWKNSTKIYAVFSKMNHYFEHHEIDFKINVGKKGRDNKIKKIPDIISREELTEIMKGMKEEERLIVSCIFNIGAGLRISEIINLKWKNIDWRNWDENHKTTTVRIDNSKNNKYRVVPIPHFTTAELYKYAEKIGALDQEGYPTGGYIFDFGSDNFKKELKLLEPEIWEYEYVRYVYDFIRHNIINKHFKKIKDRHITAHSLRHSRATELYDKYQIPLLKLKKWLGHSDISTTSLYVHMSSSKDKELMEKIGGV